MDAMRLVLFDIDGTLVDTAGAGRRAMVEAFRRRFDLEELDGAGTVPFAGNTDPSIFRAMAEAAGIEERRYAATAADLRETYLQMLERELARPDERRRLLPGISELLAALARREDVVQGLVTGNLERGARLKLESFALNDYFPGGGFGSDAADRREVARLAAEKLSRIAGRRFAGPEVTVVGDTAQDVDCARANGFRVLAVETGFAQPGELQAARPDILLDDLGDLQRVLEALGLR